MELDGLPSTVMPLPTVMLIFDPKTNQYVSRLRYMCDPILVKLAPTVMKVLYSLGFSGYCLL